MTAAHPNDQANEADNPSTPPAEPAEYTLDTGDLQPEEKPADTARRRLIGSQRDPAAYRARRTRDWTPIADPDVGEPSEETQGSPPADEPPSGQEPPAAEQPPAAAEEAPVAEQPPAAAEEPPAAEQPPAATEEPPAAEQPAQPQPEAPTPQEMSETDAELQQAGLSAEVAALAETVAELGLSGGGESGEPAPAPSPRRELPPELQKEVDEALGGDSLDDLIDGTAAVARQGPLEFDSTRTGRVVAVRRDEVFVELGAREEGCVSIKQFDQPPEPGTVLEVIVQRFNDEDGLYELTIPRKTVEVDDWADISEGMLVEAQVTGHNTGGLECEVNRLRGFIPMSQIALHRVEDVAQFVGQRWTCLITEANPERRNLVLSRRAVLEREKEEARQELISSLLPGQVHEGVVRKLVDFGAFVDIGGIDGLLHVSQLGWGRVNHPNEVLSEGQTIKVRIEKIDHQTGKMSLAYRDMLENPWTTAAAKYPESTVVRGTVIKLMEFGAFVEVEPGIEGLVHISELSHKHVRRASEVVKPGQQIEVMVLSVDTEAQRMSLSIKAVHGEPEEESPSDAPAKRPKRKKPAGPLKGGLERSGDADRFGLKW